MPEKSSGGPKPVKISDVARPGKSAPSANSKSVILPHRPVMKDPMFVADDQSAESTPATSPSSHRKIAPITVDDDGNIFADTTPAAEEVVTAQPDTAAEPKPEPQPRLVQDMITPADESSTPAANAQQDTAAETDTTSTDDDNADAKADPTAPIEADTTAAEAVRMKELADLTDSHKFYLPINQIEKRKAKRYAWAGILLILLLTLAWGDVALDAHLISIPGFKPLTHFFQ